MPYVDALVWMPNTPIGTALGTNYFDVAKARQASGTQFFMVGFVNAYSSSPVINGNPPTPATGGQCAPGWGNGPRFTVEEDPAGVKNQLVALRKAGGDAGVSFGAWGQELASACASATELQAAYQRVINYLGVTWFDFDMEGFTATDAAANTRRATALKALQVANPGLRVSFTLPASPNTAFPPIAYWPWGYPAGGALTEALNAGVDVGGFGCMTMDYGGDCPSNDYFLCTQQTVAKCVSTIQSLGKYSTSDQAAARLMVTPMIGQQDSAGQVLTLDNAQKLTSWLKTAYPKGILALSAWNANRDQSCSIGNWICSGVDGLAPWAYSNAFQQISK
jgi:chitinase